MGGMGDPRATAAAAVCVSAPQGVVEDRALPWGMDQVGAWYGRDVGAATLPLTLDGLGFANATFTMTRRLDDLGNRYVYDMAHTALPGGAATSGALTGNLTLPSGAWVVVTYRVTPST